MRRLAGTHSFSLLHLNSTKQSASNKGIHQWLSQGACCPYVNSTTLQEQRAMKSQHQDSKHTTQLQSWQPTARHKSLAEISHLFCYIFILWAVYMTKKMLMSSLKKNPAFTVSITLNDFQIPLPTAAYWFNVVSY